MSNHKDWENSWGERVYEVPWAMKNILPGTVLDIGAAESCYINYLVNIPYVTWVHLNDIRPLTFNHPKVTCFIGDITKLGLGQYDNILCISTLEHMSLEAYDQKADMMDHPANLQLTAFQKIMKLVKRQLILTIPYGTFEHGGWVLTYDKYMVDRLKKGQNVLEEVYLTLTDRDNNTYVECDAKKCPVKGMDAYPGRGMRATSVACLRFGPCESNMDKYV
jgi:hypothetical protein